MKIKLIYFLFIITFQISIAQEPLNKEEIEYIKKFIYPIDMSNPDISNNENLKFLDKIIGNSEIIALGEVTHSSSEIFKIKNRIIRYLIQKQNFDLFTIESPMVETYNINDFLLNNKSDSRTVLKNLNFKIWETKEIQNLLDWINNYNHENSKETRIAGFDMQSYEPSLKIIEEFYLKNNLLNINFYKFKKVLEDVRKIRLTPTIFTKEQNMIYKNGLTEIENNIISSNSDQKEWLLQNLTLLKQNFVKAMLAERDSFMAENLKWIKSQNQNSKIIIWAHNQHIRYQGNSMGRFLKNNFKENLINVGFTFYEGEYRVFEKNFNAIPSQKADSESLEYYLNSLNIPIFLLDLKSLKKENSKLAKWILENRKYRFTGANIPKDEFIKSKITNDFDYLIFLKTTKASELL